MNSCCKLFPRELNLALAAVLNVLGGDPELMNHPGGYSQEQQGAEEFMPKSAVMSQQFLCNPPHVGFRASPCLHFVVLQPRIKRFQYMCASVSWSLAELRSVMKLLILIS